MREIATRNFSLLLNSTVATLNKTSAAKASTNFAYNLFILIPLIFCCVFVFLIGVPGNSLVIYVLGFRQRQQRKNTGNAFVVSLAVADVFASAAVPFVIVHDLTNVPRWRLGGFLCHFLSVLNPITLVASSWGLVVISIDRYRFVDYDIIQLHLLYIFFF